MVALTLSWYILAWLATPTRAESVREVVLKAANMIYVNGVRQVTNFEIDGASVQLREAGVDRPCSC